MNKIKILLLIITVVAICGCIEETIKIPTIEVTDIKILDLSLEGATIDATIVVTNNNPFGGTFNKIIYSIYFKDERPLKGSDEYEFLGYSIDEKKVSIGTGETILHTFFNLQNRETLQVLAILSMQGHIWIKTKGVANLDLKAISYDIPFETEILIRI